jgi:hypothetical protein
VSILPTYMRLGLSHPLEGRSGGEELVRSDADTFDEPRLRWLSSAGMPPPSAPPLACQRGGCCAGVPGPDVGLPAAAAAADAAAEADWKGLATTTGLATLSLQTLVWACSEPLHMISRTGSG